MRRPSMLTGAAALLATASLLFPITCNSVAQEQPPAFPLPEMQRLSKLYVGTWTYTETYPKSPSSQNGLVNTGVYTSELGPGGNSIINRFHSKGPAGESEGVFVMTWDPKEKAYKAYFFSDSSPTALVETGQWESDALVYRAELSVGSKKIALRTVTKFLDGGKLTSDAYFSANGSPETLAVHVEAIKK